MDFISILQTAKDTIIDIISPGPPTPKGLQDRGTQVLIRSKASTTGAMADMKIRRPLDRGTLALLQGERLAAQRRQIAAVRVGETPLGDKSIADLHDLLANYTGQVTQLSQAYAAFMTEWMRKNPTEWGAWSNDWLHFLARFNLAKNRAEIKIAKNKMIPLPDSVQSADDEYKALLTAIQPQFGVVTPGSWADLRQRFAKATGKEPALTTIQPTAPDLRTSFQEKVASAPLGQPGGAALPSVGDWIKEWLEKNKTVLVTIGVGLVSLIVLPPIIGLLLTPHFSPRPILKR